MKQNIAFLLGSGISLKAGIPCTGQITEAVLSGDGFHWSTDRRYYLGPRAIDYDDGYISSVTKFLSRIKNEVDNYYSFNRRKHDTTYEDMFSVVSQLGDSEYGEYDNPALFALREKILADSPQVLIGMGYKKSMNWTLAELCSETIQYIKCIVTIKIGEKHDNISYLETFSNLLEIDSVERMKIFTLNHDTLIENYLSEKGIDFVDGFGFDGRRWVWDELNYELPRKKKELKLLKLHGSISWFYDTVEDGKIIRKPLPNDIRDIEGPEILIGTINKILDYSNRDIYWKIHGKFNNYLDETNILIVSGYSFNDKVINSRIGNWFVGNRKLIIIHPNIDKMKEKARPLLRRKWDAWEKTGNLKTIEDYFENVTTENLEYHIVNEN
ncbi:MAG: SIR2 family protein [Bacteroidota bacterium]